MADDSGGGRDDGKNESTSWFGGMSSISSLKEKAEEFMDSQRMERLHQCRVLEDIVRECKRNKELHNQNTNRIQLEDVVPGIRMVKYYGWRNVHDFDDTCQREEHAVWACRAMCLGCGHTVVNLRQCFDDVRTAEHGSLKAKDHSLILSSPNTAYEGDTADKRIPCQQLQRQVGECVASNSKGLLERKKVEN